VRIGGGMGGDDEIEKVLRWAGWQLGGRGDGQRGWRFVQPQGANCTKVACSSSGICKCCARRSAVWREGRCSSASILRILTTEQPTSRANAS